MKDSSINGADAQKIQDQFIYNSNTIKTILSEGNISQLRRQCSQIEKMKESNEQSYQIIQITAQIKDDLAKLGYQCIKYVGRTNIYLNFVAKQPQTRVIHSIACLILRENQQMNLKKIDSVLDNLIKMEHPNLQKIFKYQKTKQFYFIIMEECIGSYDELIAQEHNFISQSTYLKYSSEFLQGLEFLVGKIPISSSIYSLSNLKISFNHIGKVSTLTVAIASIPTDQCYTLQEIINKLQNSIYNQQGKIQENYAIGETMAFNGYFAQFLLAMIIPNIQFNTQKYYISENRQKILSVLTHFDNREQILNALIQTESFYDSAISKAIIGDLISVNNYLRKNSKAFLPPIDISVSQEEKDLLSDTFLSYDFVQVCQKKYIPIIDQELMDLFINRYRQLLLIKKRKPSAFSGNESINSIIGSPLMQKDNYSHQMVNELSTYVQQSLVRMQSEIPQQQFNIQIMEGFIAERIEGVQTCEILEKKEIKNLLDCLCNQSEYDKDSKNKEVFDQSLFDELIQKMRTQGLQPTIQSFLQVYLDQEKELVDIYQDLLYEARESSFTVKKLITTDPYKINADLESQDGILQNARENAAQFPNEKEINTQGSIGIIKDKIQLLHMPFNELLYPPQQQKTISKYSMMQEIWKINKEVDFDKIVSEQFIYSIIDLLHKKNGQQDYDRQTYQNILEKMQKLNRNMNLSIFLDTYLEVYKEYLEKAIGLVELNFDLRSQDKSRMKKIKTFAQFQERMESLAKLNLIEYDDELQKLRYPFKNLFRKVIEKEKFENLKKKPGFDQNMKQPLFLQEQHYKSQLDQPHRQLLSQKTITYILFSFMIIFAILLIVLIIYCLS